MKYLPYDLSYEELCFFTPQWEGERFPDGRPKVPDQTLDGILKYASITHAWGVCREAGYHHQFIDGFQSTLKAMRARIEPEHWAAITELQRTHPTIGIPDERNY